MELIELNIERITRYLHAAYYLLLDRKLSLYNYSALARVIEARILVTEITVRQTQAGSVDATG